MQLSRRQFLKLSGLGLAASTVGTTFIPWLEPQALAQTQLAAFATPEELGRRTGPGAVSFDLAASLSALPLAGRPAQLWTYNGGFPGPTLRLWEGDRVQLQLTNSLPEVTNLHFHGLHIPPTGAGDNIFREIAPGETALYEFTVPENSAGTYWYHPHRHGTVAAQLFRGLAGAIVVEGALDAPFRDLPEQLIVLKDIEVRADGTVAEHDMMEMAMGREGSLLTVNGAERPMLGVSGGAVRLRLLNAANARYYRLTVPGAELTVIATDGGFVAAPQQVEELLIAPGERYEVVARFPAAGTFELLTLPYNRAPEEAMASAGGMDGMGNMGGMGGMGDMGDMGDMGGMGGGMSAPEMEMSVGVAAPTPLMRFSVDAPGDYRVPTELASIEALDPAAATRRRRLVLGEDMAAVRFYIDGRMFDPNRSDIVAKLDTLEHWEIVNDTGMDHPMHLHVHPFQVLAPGARQSQRAWKDVVNVPAGGSVELLVPFRDYAGKTVFHCHIVEHEDYGMMSVVEVS